MNPIVVHDTDIIAVAIRLVPNNPNNIDIVILFQTMHLLYCSFTIIPSYRPALHVKFSILLYVG